MPLNIEVFPVGLLGTNCHFIFNSETKSCLIIDPGGESERILYKLKDFQLTPIAILLTHAHVDHISAIESILKQYPDLPVYLNPNDIPLYQSPANAISPWVPAAKGLPTTKDFEPIAGFDFQVIPTPGHTQGGVCFFFPKENLLISGDTLFDGAIGRTDLPGGNFKQLVSSITEKLFCLPEKTVVYPGHGSTTTILIAKNEENLF